MGQTKRINLIENLIGIAEKNEWIKTYNKQLDYFCWTKPSISKNIHLIKVSKEVLLYLNPKGLIEGMGVEYFNNNFIKHNPAHKDLPGFFTEKIDEVNFAIPKKKEKEMTNEFDIFIKDLTNDIYKENFENNRTAEDLEKLVAIAIK